jgi:hypothetical protein
MQRRIILVLAILFVLLAAAALAFVLLRDQPRPVPISVDAADENATEPYHQEMDCIDRLLQNRNSLSANEVEPALARCEGRGSGNQSQGQ